MLTQSERDDKLQLCVRVLLLGLQRPVSKATQTFCDEEVYTHLYIYINLRGRDDVLNVPSCWRFTSHPHAQETSANPKTLKLITRSLKFSWEQ